MSFLQKLKERKQAIESGIVSAATYVAKETTQIANTVTETVKENIIQPIIQLDEDVVEKRIEICRSCEHFIKDSQRCNLCGCFMNWKTRLTSAHCPIDKW